MSRILWIQHENPVGVPYLFWNSRRLENGDDKERNSATEILTKNYPLIHRSPNQSVKVIAKTEDGYLVEGLLLDTDEQGRRMTYTVMAPGGANQVLEYLNTTLSSISKSIPEQDQKFIQSKIETSSRFNKTFLYVGIAAVSLVTFYYLYGKS